MSETVLNVLRHFAVNKINLILQRAHGYPGYRTKVLIISSLRGVLAIHHGMPRSLDLLVISEILMPLSPKSGEFLSYSPHSDGILQFFPPDRQIPISQEIIHTRYYIFQKFFSSHRHYRTVIFDSRWDAPDDHDAARLACR